MISLFIKIVNMSISAGWIVLVVLFLRVLLKKAPKWVNPLLWGIVGLRLIMPFPLLSIVSLIPSAETISPQIMYETKPEIHTGISALNTVVNPVISQSFAPNPGDSANPLQIWIPIFAIIWLIGMAVLLIYMIVSYSVLRKSMKTAVLYKGERKSENGRDGVRIYLSDKTSFPFVLGFFRPVIYLPFSIKEKDIKYVLAHERAHIARKDHFFKPLSFLLLSVYWFHPLLWLAYLMLGKDMEFACDEHVIGRLPREELADYSQALLSCSIGLRKISVCPLAFGEVSVKDRVKNVLNYKKPAFWLVVAAVAALGVLAVCFLTDPVNVFFSNKVRENTDGKQMTLEDVHALSQKGEALSWTDFEAYNYVETGSGLYIRVYKIDELFSLWVSSKSMKAEEPLFAVYLKAEDGQNTQVDIRTGDVEAYIQEHQGNCILKTFPYAIVSIEVLGSPDAVVKMAELSRKIEMERVVTDYTEVVGVLVHNVEELDGFWEKMQKELTFNKLVAKPAFYRYAKEMLEAAAELENPVIIMYFPHGNLINEYSVETVQRYDEELTILIERADRKDKNVSLDGCLMALQINEDSIQDVTTFNIQVDTRTKLDGMIGDSEVIAAYTYKDLKGVSTPTVTLYEDGEFTFFFSVISSYFGYGSYQMEEDKLTLRTNDGRFLYTFTIVEDTLVFDGENSSEALWFSNITDGAVFYSSLGM
ncbi:MAG: hypothetical protein E7286_05080 [Lachnospiraceae bacterium]|nr:hypothetical protein [Lachnospiraceae bacterium]